MNDFENYRTRKMFLPHEDSRAVVSLDEFENMRSALRFYPKHEHVL